MNQSEQIGKLSDALAKAQAELKNPHFDSVNPHFKSKFASLGAVRESVIPVFAKHGIAVTQWPLSSEGHAGCRTVVSHGGEWMAQDFLIPVDKHNAHGYASAVTYTKRISLQSIACVVGDVDDDGNEAVGDNVKGEKKNGTITPTSDFWESMPLDVQNEMLDTAHRVSSLLKKKDFKGAVSELEEASTSFDGREDYMAAQWTRFDPAERRALKDNGFTFTTKHRKAA